MSMITVLFIGTHDDKVVSYSLNIITTSFILVLCAPISMTDALFEPLSTLVNCCLFSVRSAPSHRFRLLDLDATTALSLALSSLK